MSRACSSPPPALSLLRTPWGQPLGLGSLPAPVGPCCALLRWRSMPSSAANPLLLPACSWVALGESGSVVCYDAQTGEAWVGPLLKCRAGSFAACLVLPHSALLAPRRAGKELQRVALPIKRPTACTFGGEQLQHLYVTTRVETGDRLRTRCAMLCCACEWLGLRLWLVESRFRFAYAGCACAVLQGRARRRTTAACSG